MEPSYESQLSWTFCMGCHSSWIKPLRMYSVASHWFSNTNPTRRSILTVWQSTVKQQERDPVSQCGVHYLSLPDLPQSWNSTYSALVSEVRALSLLSASIPPSLASLSWSCYWQTWCPSQTYNGTLVFVVLFSDYFGTTRVVSWFGQCVVIVHIK